MVVVKVHVDDEMYARLVRDRKRAGLPSVAAHLLNEAGVLTDEIEAQEIVRRAFAQASRRTIADPFVLRELFAAEQWEGFTKGARIRAGGLFYDRALEGLDGVAIGPKNGRNHQTYSVRQA